MNLKDRVKKLNDHDLKDAFLNRQAYKFEKVFEAAIEEFNINVVKEVAKERNLPLKRKLNLLEGIVVNY